MHWNSLLLMLFSIMLVASGCTNGTESEVASSELQSEKEAELQMDYPVYTFRELVRESELIAEITAVSETEEVKSEVTEHKHAENGKMHEHSIPLNVTKAMVAEVIKGDEELEGQTIPIKQLIEEEPLAEPSSYIVFIYYVPEEDAYYSKGVNQHVEVADDVVQSEIRGKTGIYETEEFVREIEVLSE